MTLIVFLAPHSGIAQTVTPASGGTNISADDYATGTWTTITGPTITETAPGQLSPGDIRLQIPSGFEFDSTGTDPSITITSPKAQKVYLSVTDRTDSEIVFTLTGSSSGNPKNNPHTIAIGNIRIRPSRGTPLASGDITNAGSSAPGGTQNYGSLSFIAGADAKIRVESASDASGSLISTQNVEAGTFITVYSNVRDQFNNFKRNESASWSLQNITGNVVSGDLSASGGSATFTGDLVGSANIQATSGALTTVSSGLLTVVYL
ncbi:MAG: hypothetical protein FH748_08105 [Balneolaceae bacterium]|nr:hypothetical protein [Balneolaceae bacterium]